MGDADLLRHCETPFVCERALPAAMLVVFRGQAQQLRSWTSLFDSDGFETYEIRMETLVSFLDGTKDGHT